MYTWSPKGNPKPQKGLSPTLKVASDLGFSPWFSVENEGMRALRLPFKGLCRALIPSFPTKNQPVLGDKDEGLQGPGPEVCWELKGT